ncbi:MAG TPA: hypothetical protein VF062_19350 [Candidatus Limnocylindrales bacterium]
MMLWWERVARVTPVPLILRMVVFLASFSGLWLASPQQASVPRLILIMVFIATLPALLPGTRIVDVVLIGIVAAWVATTLGVGEPAEPVRVFAIATALYLAHSAAALAAAMPYDAIVDAQVPLRWAARCALVIIAGGVITAAVVVTARTVPPDRGVIVLLAGLGIVLGTVAVLTRKR